MSVPPRGGEPSLETGSNGCHMPVHTPLGSTNVQRHGALQETGEDLHLVRAAVLGNLKPLYQELGKKKNMVQ